MRHAPLADDDATRLASLRALMVLDSEPEPAFDALVQLACRLADVPIALICLVDAERQWFKAQVGLAGVHETSRDIAFCAHTILADEPLVVADAQEDVRFDDNPLVLGDPGIRFYAGFPLVLDDGARVGTLCVIDRQARCLEAHQTAALQALAVAVTQALLMRRDLLLKAMQVRSRYEQTLRDSEAHYRTLVESLDEMISLARPDGQLLYVNRAYARHFGLLPAQMQGRSLYDFVAPADRDGVAAWLQTVLRSKDTLQAENRVVAADGSEHWVAWSNSARPTASGGLLLHSAGRDITAQKRAEEALRASERLLERTGRLARVGGWRYELTNDTLYWSEQVRRIHEVDADYVPTLETALAFCAPEVRGRIQRVMQQAQVAGQGWELEFPLRTARGRQVWVRAQGEAEVENGVVRRLFGALQDVTERKLLEQRIEEGAHFVRQITDHLPLRVAYVDRDLRYRFVNQAHCLRFGIARHEILGRTRAELTGERLSGAMDARARAVLAGERQHFEFDEQVGGEMRRFECHLVPDISKQGEVQGFFATGIDITDRDAAEKALRVLTTIFDRTTDFVVQADRHGHLTYMNPALRRLLGMGLEEPVRELHFSRFNTPETSRLYERVILPAIKAEGVWVGLTTVFGADQRVIPVSHMVIGHRDHDGRIDRYSAVMRDISAVVEAQQELLRQTSTLRSVTEAIPAAVAVLDADENLSFANAAFEGWTRSERGSLIGQPYRMVLGEAAYRLNQGWMRRALAGETVTLELGEGRALRPGHWAITYIPLRSDIGTPNGCVVVAQDITNQKQESRRLLELSHRDPLTGLLNRAGLQAHLAQLGTDPASACVAVLYVDLDHFKHVNDSHGHLVGDQLLQVFSQRLSRALRPDDAIVRLGGDEFVIVVGGLRDTGTAQAVARKVLAAAAAPFELAGQVLQVSASVGLVTAQWPELDWDLLLAQADGRLYQAKQGGRGRAVSTS
ncbi:MAG: PAS domain S-box protein [Curvibacter sp.]|nr:PAS domain S-box protein [Curvibacter sp.]